MNCNELLIDTDQGVFSYRVGALIINNDKLLAAKHKNHDCYYTVGGKVKMNETSEQAIMREVYEETGFHFAIDKLVFIQERFFVFSKQNHHEIVFFYLMKSNTDINIGEHTYTDQGEQETLHWLPIRDLNQINIVPDFLKSSLSNDLEGIMHIVSSEE